MTPRSTARVLAGGRIAFGAVLLLAPRLVARRWVGELAERPAVLALARSIGIRDLVMGMIALHTVDHPDVGPRWQATCAIVDTTDVVATVAARGDLPTAGALNTALVAGGAAVAGFYCSRALKQD
jgi:hypothetical protein